MTNEFTTTTGNDLLATIIAEAQLRLAQTGVYEPLFYRQDVPRGGSSVTIPIFSAPGTASDKTEGTNHTTNIALTTDGCVITPAVNIAMITGYDEILKTTKENIASVIGRQLADALLKKRSAEFRALISGFSQTVGAAGTALSITAIEQALNYLLAAQAPYPYVMIVGPELAYGAKGLSQKIFGTSGFVNVANNTIPNQYLENGIIAKVFGFDVYIDVGIAKDVNDDMPALFASRTAIAWGLHEGMPMTIEIDRDSSNLETQYVASEMFGCAEMIDSHGVYGLFDVA